MSSCFDRLAAGVGPADRERTESQRSLLAVPSPGCDSPQHAVLGIGPALVLITGGGAFCQLIEDSPVGSAALSYLSGLGQSCLRH